jgi:predicted AAA+ superfamily ATPase
MSKAYIRWQAKTLQNTLSKRRVLILAGPRQCGKTTLVKGLADKNTIYRTLDDPTLLNAALTDPQGFVRHDNELMIIDEVQRVPLLLQAIKQNVDDNQNPGRFLLTGSANIQSLPGVTESLAGRVSKIRLRPLALGEIYGIPPHFLERAFQQKFSIRKPFRAGVSAAGEEGLGEFWDKDAYLSVAFRGGFPEARCFFEEREYQAWHRDYISALIERDLKDIANIRHKDGMAKLLEVLAAWSSKFMDVASICKSLSLARPTVESYINALEALYLVERVRPWHKTDYDRVGKQEKLFMTDTGMMAAILLWRFEKVRLDGDMNGKLLETFVFNQLSAHLDVHASQYQLTHYRDREQREVDFVVERDDGSILGIEVKAASVVDKSMFKHLIWFSEHIVPKQEFVGIVLYTGEHIVPFGPNLWAVPMSCLWS